MRTHTAASQLSFLFQVTIASIACLKSTTNRCKSYCTHIYICVNLRLLCYTHVLPTELPWALPRYFSSWPSQHPLGSLLPTIWARPVMEWRCISHLPVILSCKKNILFHSKWTKWGPYWAHFCPRNGHVTQVRPIIGLQPDGHNDSFREGHVSQAETHLPKDFSAMGMWKGVFVPSGILSSNVCKFKLLWDTFHDRKKPPAIEMNTLTFKRKRRR